MLDYESIKALVNSLENDQAPVLDEHSEIERTAYDEGYSINFEVSLLGTVTAKVHVQWGLMKQLLLNKDRWSADGPDVLHFYLRLPNQPEVEYTTVLFKGDVRRLWQSSNSACPPFPETESVEDIWVKLFNRGGYTL